MRRFEKLRRPSAEYAERAGDAEEYELRRAEEDPMDDVGLRELIGNTVMTEPFVGKPSVGGSPRDALDAQLPQRLDVSALAPQPYQLSWSETVDRIRRFFPRDPRAVSVWGPPRGGAIVSGLLYVVLGCTVAARPDDCDLLVDDIWDTGTTGRRLQSTYGVPMWCVVDRRRDDDKDLGWVVFPWEHPDADHERDGTPTGGPI